MLAQVSSAYFLEAYTWWQLQAGVCILEVALAIRPMAYFFCSFGDAFAGVNVCTGGLLSRFKVYVVKRELELV